MKKKLLLASVFLILLTTSAYAKDGVVHTLLGGVVGTGAGTSQYVKGANNVSVTVAYAGAAPTAATVKLQGSLDNSVWVDMGSTTDVSATAVGFATASQPFPYIRGNMTAYTAGSCTGVTLKAHAMGGR